MWCPGGRRGGAIAVLTLQLVSTELVSRYDFCEKPAANLQGHPQDF